VDGADRIVAGRRLQTVPGINLHVMVKSHTDSAGFIYPPGTEYVPVAIGYDARSGQAYEEISIWSTRTQAKFYDTDASSHPSVPRNESTPPDSSAKRNVLVE